VEVLEANAEIRTVAVARIGKGQAISGSKSQATVISAAKRHQAFTTPPG
jgi:hypothetical protein